ncbi:MAG: 23S rRNA (adenine(2030)-N(6))-methyltransferase RlmJ [Gammaproteobacteria bacterium]|jgi:23S rRNA (adenine2030-N6)-methyltransferase|nr:23S rRNA (adenine(2030)-N(6))-methyltransferase RlmJ [Gammaproteobacteria bacterium]
MLSYRHGFHAGNFADVLKHLVIDRILAHLVAKPKPFFCLDTHAGAGVYELSSPHARKNREYEGGIGLLWDRTDLPEPVAAYVAAVRRLNASGELRRYPGSPFFERLWLRHGDRLVLHELHPADVAALLAFAGDDHRIQVAREDGFAACVRKLPPPERRGLIVMDPSYEIKTDYRHAPQTLLRAWRKFPTGIFALWYPVIERRRVNSMESVLRASGIPRIHLFELGVKRDAAGGMTGSGMVVINPPWTLESSMAQSLPWLADVLGNGGEGYHRQYRLSGEV